MADECTITGIIKDAQGKVLAGTCVYSLGLTKTGVISRLEKKLVAVSDSEGVIHRVANVVTKALGDEGFTLPKLSNVIIQGEFRCGATNYKKGVERAIPDADTATLESLSAAATYPSEGATVQEDGVTLPTLISTFNFGSGITVEQSSGGVALITVDLATTESVQDALASFFPDAAPFDWTYDDAGNRVQLDIATATTLLKGLMSAADKEKLDGVETGATANSSDAVLLARANHTGNQDISTVTGLQDALDDKADTADLGSLAFVTPTGTPDGTKFLRDDNSYQVVTSYTDEQARDAAAGMFQTSAPYTWTVDDAGNTVTLAIDAATPSQAGLESAADKTKLDGIATGATANSSDATLLARANHTGTQAATTITEDATHRFATDAEKTAWNAKQAGSAALTDIANLTPSNDDVIQRKAGSWVSRTIAQLKADFALAIADISGLVAALAAKVDGNVAITGATKTKVTYDAKGLVTSGADATTADINDSTDRRYVTDAQRTVIQNTSGNNTGDQTSVPGNAGTAAALQTARNIDGQSFNGTADITVVAPATHAATSKATPVDADEVPLVDSAASNILKKLTWANLKGTLKSYFDTLYQAALGYTAENAANKDTDSTFAANSDAKYPSQKAVKTAVALKADDSAVVKLTGTQTIAGAKTFSSDVVVPDEVYDATAWNGSLEVPTKNAVRDKIESLGGGGGTSITLLGSATVDLNAGTTKQNIFTCPTGKKCIVTMVVMRTFSTDAAAAFVSMGWDASAGNVVEGVAFENFPPTTAKALMLHITSGDPFMLVKQTIGNAADVFGLKVGAPEGSALTCVVDVIGYTY
jgi:hypothetical protein